MTDESITRTCIAAELSDRSLQRSSALAFLRTQIRCATARMLSVLYPDFASDEAREDRTWDHDTTLMTSISFVAY
jgi:hypothetical protein